MIKGITFSDIRKELFLFLFLLIILFPLHGGRSVNATVELTNADKALVNGYVNYYNRIIISLTFNNSGATDLTDYDNGEYLIYYQHAESGSVPTIDMTDNNGNGLSDDVAGSTQSPINASPWLGNLDFNASGVQNITISVSNILATANSEPHGDRFDFEIELTTADGNTTVYEAVNWGAPVNQNFITFDADFPGMTTKTGSFLSSDYFNASITLSLQPDEDLFQEDTYKSYIKCLLLSIVN